MRTLFSLGAIGALTVLAACETTSPSDEPLQVSTAEARSGPIKVGLFAGNGAMEPYVGNVQSVVSRDSRFTIQKFWNGSVRFEDLDVVVFPGGLGGTQWSALGWEGQQNLKAFVAGGGGFVGICAGYYLAIDNGLIHATYAGPWQRGGGWVNVQIVDNPILSREGSHWIDYLNGPVIWPTPNVQVLATFGSHIGGAETMIGKPAVVAATHGKGRVVGFSPHPENSGLGDMLTDALAWAARAPASSQPGVSGGCTSASLDGRWVDPNTCVRRTIANDDAGKWFRCRGRHAEDWELIGWPTPDVCTQCPQYGPTCPY